MLVFTFEDDEKEIMNYIISLASIGAKTVQVAECKKRVLCFNDLEIDDTKRLVRKEKYEIDLTFIEYEILYLLASSPGKVYSKEQIYTSDRHAEAGSIPCGRL